MCVLSQSFVHTMLDFSFYGFTRETACSPKLFYLPCVRFYLICVRPRDHTPVSRTVLYKTSSMLAKYTWKKQKIKITNKSPLSDTWDFGDGKTVQNLRVSSPAPVTIVWQVAKPILTKNLMQILADHITQQMIDPLRLIMMQIFIVPAHLVKLPDITLWTYAQ